MLHVSNRGWIILPHARSHPGVARCISGLLISPSASPRQ